MPRTERRQHPRASASLAMRLRLGNEEVETRIRDLSCSGISFRLPLQLQPMSRVQLALELPDAPGSEALSIAGVVVRCDRVLQGGGGTAPAGDGASRPAYDTAIFFEDLSDRTRAHLARFVESRRA